jgi:hypothetical protein
MKNDITALSKGCQFWKVRSGTDWYLRRFWLDTERMCLRYVPSQKPFWNSCPTHGKYPLFVFRPMHVIKWKFTDLPKTVHVIKSRQHALFLLDFGSVIIICHYIISSPLFYIGHKSRLLLI